MARTTKDEAPAHLSAEARKMWHAMFAEFELSDAAGRALLRAACEAFQRAEEARAAIAKDGAVLRDRFGQEKVSPWCAIERDARGQMVAALRALRLAPGDTQ